MDHKTINIQIPPGAKWISISYHEDLTAEDPVKGAFQQAEKHGSAQVALHGEALSPKQTGLDVLRMRGTPIELIASAILADDWETANSAFRTSILEYLYEKIKELPVCGVAFIRQENCAEDCVQHDVKDTTATIDIQDDMNATVLHLLEDLSTALVHAVKKQLATFPGDKENVIVHIVVDTFTFDLVLEDGALIAGVDSSVVLTDAVSEAN